MNRGGKASGVNVANIDNSGTIHPDTDTNGITDAWAEDPGRYLTDTDVGIQSTQAPAQQIEVTRL